MLQCFISYILLAERLRFLRQIETWVIFLKCKSQDACFLLQIDTKQLELKVREIPKNFVSSQSKYFHKKFNMK